MRVLLVVEQLRRAVAGGIGTYATALARSVPTLNDAPDVTLYASRSRGRPDSLVSFDTPVRTTPVPSRLLTRLWDRGWAPAPSSFDVVHATALASPPVRRPARHVVAVHDLVWRLLPDAFPRRGRRWHESALRRLTRSGALFAVPTNDVADALMHGGVEGRRVHVLDPMYGSDHLPPGDQRAATELLELLGVRTGYLLSVGTLEPRKNLERVIAAYARARPHLPEPWPLVVTGPVGWGERLQPVTGVVLTGPVAAPVLAALYAGARCLVYAPLVEGWGLPAVEAMAACIPVVASPLPSTAGIGVIVDPLDIASMSAGIVEAAADDRRRAELVTAGLLRATELTWATAARRHAELWRAVAP